MKRILLFFIFFLMSIQFIYAQNEILPISVRPIVNGSVAPQNSFNYRFIFSNDPNCNSVILDKNIVIITDKYGLGYGSLNISELNQSYKYLCEYRNNDFRAVHTMPVVAGTKIYASDSLTLGSDTITSWNQVRTNLSLYYNISDSDSRYLRTSNITCGAGYFPQNINFTPQGISYTCGQASGSSNQTLQDVTNQGAFTTQSIQASNLIISSGGKQYYSTPNPLIQPYCKKLTSIATNRNLGNITDAPSIVSFPGDNDLFNYAKSDGGDIRFYDTDMNTALPYELVQFNKTASAVLGYAYVSLSATQNIAKYIYICFGNTSLNTTSNSSAVWKNYSRVYHLDKYGAVSMMDSSPYNLSLVNQSSILTGGAGIASSLMLNSGSNRWYNTSMAGIPIGNSARTVSAYIYTCDYSGRNVFLSMGAVGTNKSWTQYTQSWNTYLNVNTSSSAHSNPTCNYAYSVFVYNGTHLIPYLNGAQSGSIVAVIGLNTQNGTLQIFRELGATTSSLNQYLDEIRIANYAKSAQEIKFEYNNLLGSGNEWIKGDLISSNDVTISYNNQTNTLAINMLGSDTVKINTSGYSFPGKFDKINVTNLYPDKINIGGVATCNFGVCIAGRIQIGADADGGMWLGTTASRFIGIRDSNTIGLFLGDWMMYADASGNGYVKNSMYVPTQLIVQNQQGQTETSNQIVWNKDYCDGGYCQGDNSYGYCDDSNCGDQGSCEAPSYGSSACGSSWTDTSYCADYYCSDQQTCEQTPGGGSTWHTEGCSSQSCTDEGSCEAPSYGSSACGSTWIPSGSCSNPDSACSNQVDCEGYCEATWTDYSYCSDSTCSDQGSCEQQPGCDSTWSTDYAYCDNPYYYDQTSCEAPGYGSSACGSTWYSTGYCNDYTCSDQGSCEQQPGCGSTWQSSSNTCPELDELSCPTYGCTWESCTYTDQSTCEYYSCAWHSIKCNPFYYGGSYSGCVDQ